MFFWNSVAFSIIQWMLAIWSLVLLPLWNPIYTSHFTYCWSLTWRILSITLLACEVNTVVLWFEHSLALPFFGIGMKTDLFQSYGHCWVFQICWHIECSTFTASSFRIWNSSGGIPSPPLTLFVVMLPKAHLTSHCRISGSRWVTTPSWSSKSLRPFLYSSPVYSCHLFLISYASVRSCFSQEAVYVFYCAHPCMKYSYDSSSFLEEISVFPILLFSSTTLHCSFKKAFLSLLAILWNSAFSWIYLSLSPLLFASLLSSAICKASSDSLFPFFHFFFLWDGFCHCLLCNVASIHNSLGTLVYQI